MFDDDLEGEDDEEMIIKPDPVRGEKGEAITLDSPVLDTAREQEVEDENIYDYPDKINA